MGIATVGTAKGRGSTVLGERTERRTVIVEVPVEVATFDSAHFQADVASQLSVAIRNGRRSLPGDDYELSADVTVHASREDYQRSRDEAAAVTTGTGVTMRPWTDGHAVGFELTHPDGQVEVLCLQPPAPTPDEPTATEVLTVRRISAVNAVNARSAVLASIPLGASTSKTC